MTAPIAAPACWPYPGHRTMAEVVADEARGCFCELVEENGDAPDCAFGATYDEEA